MAGVVRLEDVVMDQGVRLEGVGKLSERAVPDETMHRPFQKTTR